MSRAKKQFVKLSVNGHITAKTDCFAQSTPDLTETRVYFKGIRFKSFDFSPWYGGRIDEVTRACQEQINRFLRGLDAEYSQWSINTLCQHGMRSVLEYGMLRASALGRELTLADVNREFFDGYIGSLDSMVNLETISKKGQFSAAKSVFKALCNRGLISEVQGGDYATFPKNPFPGCHRHARGFKPLSGQERKDFSEAVKKAVLPLFSQEVEPTSNLLAYALLVVALHTGRNTTPLLEMGTDCLRPHPKTGTSFLVLFKRRSHAENKVALRGPTCDSNIDSIATLRPTVVDLINRVIWLSNRLRAEAPEEFQRSVWLYRMRSSGHGTGKVGDVSALDDGTLATAIQALVRDYNLVDNDGKPMHINVSRLRKSFVNRIFEILGGDLVGAAAAAGNTARVAGINYLRPSEE